MTICEVCGNEIAPKSSVCRFCGSKVEQADQKPEFNHETVNIEQGRPVVEDAVRLLELHLKDAKKRRVTAITVIHGYGSSGKGGKIRLEVRKTLDHLKAKGLIYDYGAGEDFNRRMGPTKNLLQRFPGLAGNKNLGRGNRGITLVVP